MANFVPGDASPIADIRPWSPDWSFLEQVYGVTQVRYDRGFNMVKNLYNSVLNSPLTNPDNQAFRNDMFQKIQGSLRNVSALDLSNPTNVMRAQKLLDPITDDKELAYDMYFTKYQENQKKIMNSYKNSTDPKMRNMYSDYARMDMQFAEEDLRNARRGDGSITAVQPRDFVPFENVNEYLNAQAAKAKLKVKGTISQGGYLITKTNGELAEVPFSVWAGNMLSGEQFQRQFDVVGRVTAESQIRDLVKQGIPRDEAVKQIAANYTTSYKNSQKLDSESLGNSLTDVERQIQIIEKQYPDGNIPESKTDLRQKYKDLLMARYEINSNKAITDEEIKKVDADPDNYVMNNLQSLYSRDAKRNAATVWGVSTADATAEVDIKPDQKVIADMNRAAANARAYMANQTRLKIAAAQMEWDKQKFGATMDMKEKELALKKAIATAKKTKDGKAILPEEQYLGSILGSSVAGAELLGRSGVKNRQELFNNAFGAQDGLINIVVPKNTDYGKYYSVLSKVKNISQNSGDALTESEKGILKEYSKLVKMPVNLIDVNFENNPGKAGAYLEQLAANTFEAANTAYQTLTKTNKKEATKYVRTFDKTMASMKRITQEKNEIDKNNTRIANLIYDYDTKTVKPGYEGAKVISMNADGTPLFDISGMTEAQKNAISNVISPEWNKRGQNPVGGVYGMTAIKSDEMFQFFTDKANKGIKIDIETTGDKKITVDDIRQLILGNKKDIFGNEYIVAYDPGARVAKVKLGLDAAAEVTGALDWAEKANQNTINIEIPYSVIESTPNGVLDRLKAGIKKFEIDADASGIMESFSRDPYSSVKAPSYLNNYGIDYTAQGADNSAGQYGVKLDFQWANPTTREVEYADYFIQADPGDPDSYTKAVNVLNTAVDAYKNYLISIEDAD